MKRESKQQQQQQGQATEPQDDDIARTAFQIWESEGRPDGHDLEHWLQAKSQLAVDKGRAGKLEAAQHH